MGSLSGKVAIVSGAGQGIGREEALALAREGAVVIVNDVETGQEPGRARPAEQVVAEIVRAGGTAYANFDDVSDFEGARNLVGQALGLGGLDIVVCNAGIVRDRMLYKMSEDEWDAVIRVHLRGHFALTRFAAEHWRGLAKESGGGVDGRLIYTSSEGGLYGNIGQANYAAAKAGITGLCFTAAHELASIGVTVNTISPRGRTPMTAGAFGEIPVPEGFDEWDPSNVTPLVVYLCGDDAREISGQVFIVYGGVVSRLRGWSEASTIETDHQWSQDELAREMPLLVPGLKAGAPRLQVVIPSAAG